MIRIVVIVTILLLASGCLNSFTKPHEIKSKEDQTFPPITPLLPISPRETESVVTKVILGAIGDILIHDRVSKREKWKRNLGSLFTRKFSICSE